jgi:hypothetical protein
LFVEKPEFEHKFYLEEMIYFISRCNLEEMRLMVFKWHATNPAPLVSFTGGLHGELQWWCPNRKPPLKLVGVAFNVHATITTC